MSVIICDKKYELDDLEVRVDKILSVLFAIKEQKDHTLAFRSGCRSGVCGSCAVLVNGVERLSCKTSIKDGDIIEPLRHSKVIKDLVVDMEHQERFLTKAKAFLEKNSNSTITSQDEKAIDTQTNCILCNSCYSVCPVYDVNSEFLAPFALTRVFRYINDKKEELKQNKIEAIQTFGIWDCTLCGSCNMVCPAHIDIKGDIMRLRNLSAQFGYNDPNLTNFMDNQNFGFDPNSF